MKRVSIKNLCRIVCAALCAVFAIGLVGCSTESDYANFVRWQARYEVEKELVDLLREYDEVYKAYTEANYTIAFVLDDEIVLTDEHIEKVEMPSDTSISITFTAEGTDLFFILTSLHIGEVLEIVKIQSDQQNVMHTATIASSIVGDVTISRLSSEKAKELYTSIDAKCADNMLKRIAVKYNEKRQANKSRTISSDYLPNSLPEAPKYIDVSKYLKKAEAMGF